MIAVNVVDVPPDSELLSKVVILWRRHSATLGPFPLGAFEEMAQKGWIMAAIAESELVGYLLFREVKSQRRVAIVHLCVEPNHRHAGVGRILIDHLKSITTAFDSISLHCRRDYDASKVWPRYGFVAIGHKRGRSQAGRVLTCWRFEHRPPPLIGLAAKFEMEDDRPVAVIDANVFFDICAGQCTQNEESLALAADWLDTFVRVRLTEEILNEIERNADFERTRSDRALIRLFGLLPTGMREVEAIGAKLRQLLPEHTESVSDESDLRQLSHAIAGEARFFVTRDSYLLRKRDLLLDEFGLNVLPPHDLMLHLDEEVNLARYTPGRLAGARVYTRAIQAGEMEPLAKTFHVRGESKVEFERILRRCLADPIGHECRITEESRVPLTICIEALSREQNSIELPVLRQSHAKGPSGLVRYILFNSMCRALDSGKKFVRVSERHLSLEIRSALDDVGFIRQDGCWIKPVLAAAVAKHELSARLLALGAVPDSVQPLVDRILASASQDPSTHVSDIAQLERIYWPLKVLDVDIPVWIVPIKPRWAAHLFEERIAEGDLFGADRELILRNDNVYYRKKGTQRLTAPSRVLWYVSEERGIRLSGHLLACSNICQVEIGRPKELFQQFRRLGVYRWRQVSETVENDLVREMMAFRFRDTELLKPISYARLKQIIQTLTGKQPNLTGPFRIDSECFSTLYREGSMYG